MSLDRFRSYQSQLPEVKYPNCEWSIRWIKRIFEFLKNHLIANLTFNTDQLIAFLVAMKKNGVPAWQRHQAAVTAGRYQMMTCGAIEPGIHEVIKKLADIAKSERNGDAAAAERETHFPKVNLLLSPKLARHCGEEDTSSTLKRPMSVGFNAFYSTTLGKKLNHWVRLRFVSFSTIS